MKKTFLRFLNLTLALNLLLVSNLSYANKGVASTKKIKTHYYSVDQLNNRFASWGIDPNLSQSSINLERSWKSFEKKKDIVVAVVDTGIDPNHPFLSKNIYVPKGAVNSNNYGVDFSKKSLNSSPIDTHGHGTHVSGIVKSIFPEVKILALKYYNPQASGQANLNSTIKALEYAVDQNVDIIN